MVKSLRQATMWLILQLCVVLLLVVGVENHVWGKMDVGKKALYGDFFAEPSDEPGAEWLWEADGARDAAPWGDDFALDVRDGPNLYAYVQQNPWTSFDPEGLFLKERLPAWAQFAVDRVPHLNDLDRAADTGMLAGLVAAQDGWKNGAMLAAGDYLGSKDFAESLDGHSVELQGSVFDGNVGVTTREMGTVERTIKGTSGLANMIMTVFGAKASVKPKLQTHVTPPKLPAPVNTAAEVVQESGEAVAKMKSLTDYSHIADPKNITASTRPTPRQVRQMKEANRAQNGGVLRDDVTGEVGVDSSKSMEGVTPPPNSIEVDHFIPVDGGGTRAQSNLRLLLKTNNRKNPIKCPNEDFQHLQRCDGGDFEVCNRARIVHK